MRWLAFLLVFVPLSALAQEDDRSFLTRFLEDNLSAEGREIRLTGFEGALSSTARVAEITLSDAEGVWLRFSGVELGWNRAALLSARVEIERLVARDIELMRWPLSPESGLPAPEASGGFSLPELPVSLSIGTISAARIVLGPEIMGEQVVATLQGQASLDGGAGSVKVDLRRTDQPGASFLIEADYSNTERELALLVNLTEPEGGIAARALGLPGAPSVGLNVIGAGPFNGFKADVRLATDGRERLSGDVTLSEAPERGQVLAARLHGDVTPLLAADFHPFFGPDSQFAFEGWRAADGALTLETLRLSTARMQVTGRLALDAERVPSSIDLVLDLGDPTQERLRLPLAGDPVFVSGAKLRLGFDAANAESWELSGRVEGLKSATLDLDRAVVAGGGRIGRDAAGAGGLARAGGTLGLAMQGLSFADAGVDTLVGPAPLARLEFDWSQGAPLRLGDISLRSAGMRLGGAITFAELAPNPVLDGRLSLDLAEMSRLSTLAGRPLAGSGHLEWNGQVAPVSGVFDGILRLRGRDVSLGQVQADTLLQGTSALELDIVRGAEGTEIRKLDISARRVRLQAGGWLRSSGHDLSATFSLEDLGDVQPGASGSVTAKAQLSGDGYGEDRLDLRGTTRDLSIGQITLDALLRDDTAFVAELRHQRGGVWLDRLRAENPRLLVQGKGWADPAQDNAEAEAVLTLRDLGALGAGFGGDAEALLRFDRNAGRDQASLVAQMRDLALGSAVLVPVLRGRTTAAARLGREGGTVRIEGLTLENPQLALTGAGIDRGQGWAFDLSGRLVDLGLLVPEVPGPVEMTAELREDGPLYRIAARATGPAGLSGDVSGHSAQDFSALDLNIKGAVDAAVVGAFAGPGVALRGPVDIDLRLNGRPGLSALSGRIGLSDGRLSIADPPFVLNALTAQALLSGGRAALEARAQAQTGGRLVVGGSIGLTAPFDANLSLDLASLGLSDPELFQTSLSGGLTLRGPARGGALLAGEIALGPTELRIPSSGLGGVAAFPDLTHRGEPAAVRRTRLFAGVLEMERATRQTRARPYGLDIGISAPARVFVRGRGLDAELGGQFRITGTTDAPVPAGALDLIRGRLDLLGKRFVFSEGRIGVDGSLVPDLRLVATTKTDAGDASIVVDGPADAPEIRFESALGLPEEEVVARLLFGRGLDTLTPFQAAQLAAAVASLTGRSGGVMDRLRQGLGLDDFDVGTDSEGQTQVRAGRYIADNIYTDVTVSSGGKSEVSINLDVTDSITLKGSAASDGGSGLGLFFERDY